MKWEMLVAKLVELLQSNPTTLQGIVAALSAIIVTGGSILCFNEPKRPRKGALLILCGIAMFFIPTLVPPTLQPPAPPPPPVSPVPRDFQREDWRIFEQKGFGFRFHVDRFNAKTHEITGKMVGMSWPLGFAPKPDEREPPFHGTYDNGTGILIFTRDDVHQDYTINLHTQDYGTGKFMTRDDGTFDVSIFRLNPD